ncbi:MAG: tyrosine-protein phosphatase [Acidobacteriota bacterium]|nr:tyrosine-protein phosphatase [Acidobacteriota bacterium]
MRIERRIHRSVQIISLTLGLSITLASGATMTEAVSSQGSDREQSSESTLKPRASIQGIPRFGEVTPFLYRGGQPTESGFEALAKMGIDIVVDTRGSRRDERNIVTKLGMRYAPIPWHCPFPKNKTFARFLALLRENPGKKVFVHCRLGNDRTGMMIASYRMAEQGWTAKRAKKEMQAYGFSATHHLICPGLSGYEEDFPEKFEKSRDFQSLRTSRQPAVSQP